MYFLIICLWVLLDGRYIVLDNFETCLSIASSNDFQIIYILELIYNFF